MKVRMVPGLSELGKHTSGITQVIAAYHEHLPQFGIELVDEKADSWDLLAAHAGATGGGCDVCHCHGLYWTGDRECGGWEYGVNARIVEAVRHAKAVTVPSNWVANVFRRDMHLQPAVVPHGIDWERWQEPVECSGYVLYNKNRQGDVCDATDVLRLAERFPDTRFVSTFAPSRPPSNVTVTGVVPHEEMRGIVLRAGLYLAITQETFGVGILEALASGVPVLGYARGGILDVVQHGIDGYLAAPGDLDDLARGLAWCMEHRVALSANARELARAWTWEHACELVAGVYEAALRPDPPTVAVVIPSYNYAEFVGRAVRSALAQDYTQLTDVIVVDDGSQDDGATAHVVSELAATDPRVRYHRKENGGVATARNRGIALTNTKYVCCLDADDAIEPRFLSTMIAALEQDRSLGVAYSGLAWVAKDRVWKGDWPHEYHYDQQLQGENQVPTCCVMRREAWERAGGYRQRYAPQGQGAEDAELWLRLGALGWGGIKASDEPLFLYTAGGRTQQPGFRKNIDWLAGHPWVQDQQHPFASQATPARGSHPARSYDEPLVSVVIPVSERHLPLLVDALDSVEAQTLRRWEVIVAYDGKLDESTRSWLQSGFPYVKIEETGKQSGAAHARNVGAAAARAPFLLFLDADDVIDPRALEHMLGAVESLEEPAIIYTSSRGLLSLTPEDARKFKAAGELVSYQDRVALIEQRAAEYDCKLAVRQPGEHKQYFWCYVTSLVPRAWHEELGGFDEHLPTWEDWDYWIRMARAGRPFALLDEPLITYRYDTGTLREHGKTIKPEMLKTLRAKHAGKVNEKMACMGCKKKLVAPMPVRKSNLEGEEMTAKDSDFVLARYVRPSNGSQGVVGAAQFPTAISQNMRRVRGGWVMWYGYHSPGDVFLVHKADVRTQPGWFQLVKETAQASPVGDRAATLSNRVPTREAALPPAPVTVKPTVAAAATTTTAPTTTTTAKPAAPRTFDFQTLPGVTPSIAAQLAKIYDGPAAIVAGGVELLMQVRGVGEAKATVIIEAARGMLVPPSAPVNTKDPIVELVGELEKVATQGMPAPSSAPAPDVALIEQLEKVL